MKGRRRAQGQRNAALAQPQQAPANQVSFFMNKKK